MVIEDLVVQSLRTLHKSRHVEWFSRAIASDLAATKNVRGQKRSHRQKYFP
jgi:hypothetical protein